MVLFIAIFNRDGSYLRTECFEDLKSAERYISSWLLNNWSLKLHYACSVSDIPVQCYIK